MARRRFNFGDEDEYVPSRFSPRVARNFSFDENDERFDEPSAPNIGTGYQGRKKDESDPYQDIITRYKGILDEEQPALRRYRESMQNLPKRQDYDLGKWGRVGAALAGFGAGYRDPMEGVKVAQELRGHPYRQAMADYEANLNNQGQEVEFEAKDRATKMKGLDLELESMKDKQKNAREDRLAQSQIDRREAQNAYDEGRLSLDQLNAILARDRFNMDFAHTSRADSLASRLGDSTIDYRNRTAATGEANAQTNRGRLNFEQGPKFNFEQDKFQNEFFQRGAEEEGRNRRDNPPTPSYVAPNAQNDAQDAAARELYTQFPAYRNKYLTSNDKGYISLRTDLPQEVLDSPEYKKLELELRGRARRIMNQSRGGGNRYEFPDEEQ